jgi:hypothetical protein
VFEVLVTSCTVLQQHAAQERAIQLIHALGMGLEREREARESAHELILSARNHYQDGLASATGIDYAQMVQEHKRQREREERAVFEQTVMEERQALLMQARLEREEAKALGATRERETLLMKEQEALRATLQVEINERLRQDLEHRRLQEEEQLHQRHSALECMMQERSRQRQPPQPQPQQPPPQPREHKKKFYGPPTSWEDDELVSRDTTAAKDAPGKLESILAALFPFLRPTSPQAGTSSKRAFPQGDSPGAQPPAIIRALESDKEGGTKEQSKEVEEREVEEREVRQETPVETHATIKADAVAVALTKLAVARKHRNGVKLQLAELRGARERMMSEQAAKRQPTDLKDVDLGGISTEMRRLRQLDHAAIEDIHVISDMIVESEETLLEIDRKITKLALKVEKSSLAKQHTSNSGACAWNDVILHLEVGRVCVCVKVCVCVCVCVRVCVCV